MQANTHKRQATPMERLFTRSPFSLVTMVARIKGAVTEEVLADAVAKVQLRHTNLRVRLVEDEQHNPWFTTKGAAAYCVCLRHEHRLLSNTAVSDPSPTHFWNTCGCSAGVRRTVSVTPRGGPAFGGGRTPLR